MSPNWSLRYAFSLSFNSFRLILSLDARNDAAWLAKCRESAFCIVFATSLKSCWNHRLRVVVIRVDTVLVVFASYLHNQAGLKIRWLHWQHKAAESARIFEDILFILKQLRLALKARVLLRVFSDISSFKNVREVNCINHNSTRFVVFCLKRVYDLLGPLRFVFSIPIESNSFQILYVPLRRPAITKMLGMLPPKTTRHWSCAKS